MAVVATCEDWLPFALGLGYVGFTHAVFGPIEASRVYNHTTAINNPWVWGLIHGIFVLFLALALLSNWASTERSRAEAREQLAQARDRAQQIDDLAAKQAEIEQKPEDAEEAQAEDLQSLLPEFTVQPGSRDATGSKPAVGDGGR